MKRWWRTWWVAVVVVLGIIVGGVGQGLAYEADPDGWKWTWRGVAALGALLAAGAPLVDRKRRESAVAAIDDAVVLERAAQTLRLNDALDPLIEKLCAVVEGKSPEAAAEALITQALNCAAHVIGPERTRVCYFEADAAVDKIVVSPHTHTGRHGKPRSTFHEGTSAGDAVLRMLVEDQPIFCPDVSTEPPPGWDASRPRDYRTFISAPVRVGTNVYGFVSVDAPEPGDLLESDVPFLRVLGTVIAVGLKMAEQDAEGKGTATTSRRKPPSKAK